MPLVFDIAGFEDCPHSRVQGYVYVSGRSLSEVIREGAGITQLHLYVIKDRNSDIGHLERVLLQAVPFLAQVSAIYILGKRRGRVEPGVGCILELKGDGLEGVAITSQRKMLETHRIFFQLSDATGGIY